MFSRGPAPGAPVVSGCDNGLQRSGHILTPRDVPDGDGPQKRRQHFRCDYASSQWSWPRRLSRKFAPAIVARRITVETKKAAREYTAPEEVTKHLLDEERCRLSSACGAREEAFLLLANKPAEECLLRLVAFVVGYAIPFRDRLGETPLGNLGDHIPNRLSVTDPLLLAPYTAGRPPPQFRHNRRLPRTRRFPFSRAVLKQVEDGAPGGTARAASRPGVVGRSAPSKRTPAAPRPVTTSRAAAKCPPRRCAPTRRALIPRASPSDSKPDARRVPLRRWGDRSWWAGRSR
jgi:hypothetical protein